MNQYLSPNPDQLKNKINHIVVLMLENRSFDNLLGWLYQGRQVPDNQSFEGLSWDLWNPLDNIDSDGNPFIEKVQITQNGIDFKRNGKIVSNPEDFNLPDPDPGEVYSDINHQLYLKYQVGSLYPPEPINMGFVQNYQNAMLFGVYSYGDSPTDPRKIMVCYTPDQTPVLSELARSFAVCDHYFASVPSQTLPNRSFIHAGTSCGNVNNNPNAFCNSKTIFNQIQEKIDRGNKELSWGIFSDNLMSGNRDKDGSFKKDHFSLTRLAMTELHDPRFNKNFYTLENFYSSCKTGKLPSYSFLEPIIGGDDQNDQHPPSDIRPGEKFIADIYNAIKDSLVFKETLFIITYDEHGGCYDHVPPPCGAKNPDPSDPPGQHGFKFNRFGVRVPCVLVNPYIPKGLIARPAGNTPFDHTSVIKTVQNCLSLEPYLTERSNAAPDFSCVLRLTKPRHHKDLAVVRPLKWKPKTEAKELNNLHRQIAKMICEMTGNSHPDEEQIIQFIQENYNIIFGESGHSDNS